MCINRFASTHPRQHTKTPIRSPPHQPSHPDPTTAQRTPKNPGITPALATSEQSYSKHSKLLEGEFMQSWMALMRHESADYVTGCLASNGIMVLGCAVGVQEGKRPHHKGTRQTKKIINTSVGRAKYVAAGWRAAGALSRNQNSMTLSNFGSNLRLSLANRRPTSSPPQPSMAISFIHKLTSIFASMAPQWPLSLSPTSVLLRADSAPEQSSTPTCILVDSWNLCLLNGSFYRCDSLQCETLYR